MTRATERADTVLPLFVFDSNILGALVDAHDRRVNFIHRSVAELDRKLRSQRGGLWIRHGDPVEIVPQAARAVGADLVVAARDFETYAKHRDRQVTERLATYGIQFESVLDHVVFAGEEILNESGEPYRVYTPYMKAWKARFSPERVAERVANLQHLMPTECVPASDPWGLTALGFRESDLWLEPGEDAGRAQLEGFLANKVDHYHERRDLPAGDHTSGLSVHLRFGTVGIREAVRGALARPGRGAEKWLNELIWRDFYAMILDRYPHVETKTFRPEYDTLDWPGHEEHAQAWAEGRTGYPLVDAAMRCLVATGWMHNRLRMVVASFLTKDLLVDYRWGEAFFARYLLDFDLASNNGGWQWAASTGVDAQPYFRIFNPVLQSRKFDPTGEFIRRWVPELSAYPDAHIHWPHEVPPLDQALYGAVMGSDYPHPIVDHAIQRERAVRLLESVRK